MNALSLILNTAALLYSGLQIVVAVVVIASLLFSKPPSQEELERASMRSLSWPTDGDIDLEDPRDAAERDFDRASELWCPAYTPSAEEVA